MLLRGRVIHRKMLEALSTKIAKKPVGEFCLLKKDNNRCFNNNNNNVGKIIGRLVVQKHVCDQKLLQKTVCDRKASDTEKVNDRNCVKRVYDKNKLRFSLFIVKKLLLMKKVVLKTCEGKVAHRKRQGLTVG